MSIKNLIETIKSKGLLQAMGLLEQLYKTAIENEQKLAEIEAKCAALAAKGMELAAEAAVVYGKYNETQLPDREIMDMQTIQEMHDLCAGVKSVDAYQAELRAQGVDMYADSNRCSEENQAGAFEFAAQLRQEGVAQ